jgi:3-deoxy-7-phosphoheptulonate synthase
MLIVMNHDAPKSDMQRVKDAITNMGYKAKLMPGADRTAIAVLGNQGWVDDAPFSDIKGILEILHVTKPYKLVSRDFHPKDTSLRLRGGKRIGGKSALFTIAGPCAIESEEQMLKTARYLKKIGVPAIRGGAYKPRTSVHSFQGMREEGIKILAEVRKQTGLITVTEVMTPDQVEFVAENVDVLQIGARNMQNFDLLLECGKVKNPVVLKRGLAATIEEWVACAEYISVGGNPNIILCERGIRTFETAMRNTADLAVIPYVKSITHLPVIFDPSHATGVRSLVAPMALAATVAGAHGLMIEVHPDPDKSTSDAGQTLGFKDFKKLNTKLGKLSEFAKTL